MFALSLNFRTANIAFRERFAWAQDKTAQLLLRLRENAVTQAVYLITCNRCELYGEGDYFSALCVLSEFAEVPLELVKKKILIFDGEKAVRHLFAVACGIESMVKGEDEILRQVKDAFAFSQQRGFTAYSLNTIFKAAITDAKKIKTDTLISKTSVSVATLAASECRQFGEKGMNLLLIGGSGEIGRLLLKNLISYDRFQIFAAVREHHIREKKAVSVPYAMRYEYINKADIVISATKSPHFTVTYEEMKRCETKRRLFLDLAVPRDIDRDIGKLPGTRLMTIDDFQQRAEENAKTKREEFSRAGSLMEDAVDTLLKEMLFHSLLPVIEQKIDSEELKRFLYQYRDTADSKEFESFARVFLRMENKNEAVSVFHGYRNV